MPLKLFSDLLIEGRDPVNKSLLFSWGKDAEWIDTLRDAYYSKRVYDTGRYTLTLSDLVDYPDTIAIRASKPISLSYSHTGAPGSNTVYLRADGAWIYSCRGYIDETHSYYLSTLAIEVFEDNTEIEILVGSKSGYILQLLASSQSSPAEPEPSECVCVLAVNTICDMIRGNISTLYIGCSQSSGIYPTSVCSNYDPNGINRWEAIFLPEPITWPITVDVPWTGTSTTIAVQFSDGSICTVEAACGVQQLP